MNVPTNQCIGVEDSINGILSVYNAGIKAVMIPDLEQPTPEIESKLYAKIGSLPELINLLQKELTKST